MKSVRFLLAVVALLVCSQTHAVERDFCAAGATCAPDTIRVQFDPPGSGSLIEGLNVGDEFTITIVVDVESRAEGGIQGFSLGLAHDPEKLQILEAAVTQTVKDLDPFFDSASLAIGRGDEEIDPNMTEVRFGIVAAAIFPIIPSTVLPEGNGIGLATARYRVLTELDDVVGTLLEFVNDLIPNPGAPPTAVNYTIGGSSIAPEVADDGEVKGIGNGGGNDCDGLEDWSFIVGDDPAVNPDLSGASEFDISMRNIQDALGFSIGVAIRGNDWTFEDDIVGNANDTVQLLITDSDGIDHIPVTNSATGPSTDEASILSIERGDDIASFDPGDFLGVDLNPTVGGPGFTVGYVSDTSGTSNVIPATGADEPCFNHILKVTLTPVVVGDCPLWGFAFGPDPRVGNLNVTGTSYPISMRNQGDALGFSMGVAVDGGNHSFVDDVLGNTNTTIQLLIPDNDGIEHVATASNTATDGQSREVVAVTEGADIAGNSGDFLAVDLNPTVGGNGFTVGYISDADGTGDTISATPVVENECATNEILIVSFVGGDGPFVRGDCNGNGRLNVTDGAICAQNIFFNRIVFFDCDEMLDANDDDQLDMSDPIMILMWVFLAGPDLPGPFPDCGVDPADDTLGCVQGQTRCSP